MRGSLECHRNRRYNFGGSEVKSDAILEDTRQRLPLQIIRTRKFKHVKLHARRQAHTFPPLLELPVRNKSITKH